MSEEPEDQAWRTFDSTYGADYGTTFNPGHHGRQHGDVRADDRLRDVIHERFALDQRRARAAREVEVSVASGEVTLTGTVASLEEKAMWYDAVVTVPDVLAVHDLVHLAPDADGLDTSHAPGSR